MIALHVIEPAKVGFSEYGSYVGPEEDKGEAMSRLQAIKAPSPMVTIEYRLLEGDPATVIAETAAEIDADLVVMGTHGRTGFTRFIMGSVAEEVLRKATCPVLTVRDVATVKVEEPVAAAEPAAI
jgi:nucleotide-binding universal stress UspA family protein